MATEYAPERVPTSTYRFQITAEFDLFAAADRLAYVRDLGVDWVYLSPILAAEPGSSHGYDVIAHDRIDDSRGGAEGLATLSAEARRLGLGVLVDIVPNHMGVATPSQNAWWWDLLLRGRDSEHAVAFDVDFEAGDGKIRIPVLGDDGPDTDTDTDTGGVQVDAAAGVVRYHDHTFPLAPGTSSLGNQHYELVHWSRADHDLNYRRFFAVNTLAGVRVEVPDVLASSHVEIKRWFDEGLVDGLRVDHPDGLRYPQGYLDDLARITGGAYVLVEKILEPGEALPSSWATSGTTGYDALGYVDRVLTDPEGQPALDNLESRLRGTPVDWASTIHDTKRAVADGILGSEVRRIAREVATAVDGRSAAATTLETARIIDAVAELLACFPVYRSYLPEGREHLDRAIADARARRPDLAATLDALEPLLGDPAADAAKRFQQTSGMVMAKGVEDCAFYRWSRLTSLNEVGGDPSEFALAVDEFHQAMATRHEQWPHAMTTLSTHDTKRGEDVRARIATLAEIPHVWETHLDLLLTRAPLPDRGFGSLLWQAILGAWPAAPHPDLRQRLHGYAEKAMREAGDRTTWTRPDSTYEAAVHAAVDAAFDDESVRRVLAELLAHVVAPGWSNSLAAKLVALTMPGVPDVYQGSELWEQSLVDPDNRRPVDLDLRTDLLAAVCNGARLPLTRNEGDPGGAKLLITHRALTLRRDRPELFTTYSPVNASGPAADHVLAFDRGGAVTVVTRLPIGLDRRGGWGETELELPPGAWRDLLTDRPASARLAELLATYPVALLVRDDQ